MGGSEKPVDVHAIGARSRNSFDAIRLAAAFAVLASHHFALSGRVEPHFGSVGTIGFFAVAIFFVLSGFFVSASWDRDPDLVRYWIKRSLRLFPALIAVVGISIMVIGVVETDLMTNEYFAEAWTWSYWRNAVLIFGIQFRLPGVFTTNAFGAVNGSLWSLPVELFMYILISLGRFAFPRISARWFYPGLAALFAVGWWVKADPSATIVTHYLNLGVFFFVGASIQALGLKPRLKSPIVISALVIIAIGFTGMGKSLTTLLWLAVPAVILAIGLRPSRLGSRVARAGDISYGVYLWAFPVQQIVIGRTQTAIGFWPSMLLAAIITTCLAVASRVFIEGPAHRIRTDQLAVDTSRP